MDRSEAAARVCDYCGLPLSDRGATSDDDQPRFCCLGCRFAASVTADDGEARHSQWTLTRLGLSIFFTMNVMVCTLALWSRDIYPADLGSSSAASESLHELLRYGALLCSAPVLLLLGGPLLEQAWQTARRGEISIDWLLAAGVAASFGYSVISLATGGQHVYFEVGCMVLLAVTLGRWFEATGKLKTTQALRTLQKLLPETVRMLGADQQQTVPLAQVQAGDLIRVLPGERIPLDGNLERGSGGVDEQLITGESLPRHKHRGDPVYGGSLNLDGDLQIRVTSSVATGTLQRLVDAVQTALHGKGREQRLADQLAHWFVPVIGGFAVLVFIAHWHVAGFHAGTMRALAVVLIACPCALAIATPLATWAAMGTSARQQLVFRDGDALSRLARVGHIYFDKTGTLTTGQVQVAGLVTDGTSDPALVGNAARWLAESSNHLCSQAIANYLSELPPREGSPPTQPPPGSLTVETYPGLGLGGTVPHICTPVMLGSLRFLQQQGCALPASINQAVSVAREAGNSVSGIGWGGSVRGIFEFCERLRPEAPDAIAELHQLGITCEVLTGDHVSGAARWKRDLGLPVRSDLLPSDKLEIVQRPRGKTSRHKPTIAMVGDGVNDAPALAAADVGIAMACGADVTRDTADVCLLGNDLLRLPWAIKMARRTVRTIRQNLFWAFAYNVVGVGMAASGWLSPVVAAIAMVGSSFFVISNSLRLTERAGSPDRGHTTKRGNGL